MGGVRRAWLEDHCRGREGWSPVTLSHMAVSQLWTLTFKGPILNPTVVSKPQVIVLILTSKSHANMVTTIMAISQMRY